jgi:hypothetical protein
MHHEIIHILVETARGERPVGDHLQEKENKRQPFAGVEKRTDHFYKLYKQPPLAGYL